MISDEQIAVIRLQLLLLCPDAVETTDNDSLNIVTFNLPNIFVFFVDKTNCCVEDIRPLDLKYVKTHYGLTPEDAISKLTEILYNDI
jgi:hypothetical protein